MIKEEKVLIELCKAYLYDTKPQLDDKTDYLKLYKLSYLHNLTAICYCALAKAENKNLVPKKIFTSFQDKFFDCVYIYEKQSQCIKDIEDILSSSQTPYILFKGSRLKELYPTPETRVMGDIDILIRESDRDKVKKLLINNDFKCTAQNGPVYDYRHDNIITEVHTRILNEKGMEQFPSPFDNYVTFENCNGTLDNDYHFAYLIAHTAHHFKFYGAGIKLLLDLAVMQKECNINLDKVMQILKSVNLEKFAKVILSVCKKWFDVGKSYTDNTQKTEDFLCKHGVFGFADRNKGAVITRREMEKGRSISAFKVKLSLAFPSYEKLKEIPYIKFIEGRPYLTPYAWAYRFYYNIKNRKEFMKNAVSSISDEQTIRQAQQELEFFKEIGLV